MERKYEASQTQVERQQEERRQRVEHALIISVGAQGLATPDEVLAVLPDDVRSDADKLMLDPYADDGLQPDATSPLIDYIKSDDVLSKHLDVVGLVDCDAGTAENAAYLQLSNEGSAHFSETFYDTRDDDLRRLLMTILANNAPEHFRQ